MVESYLTVTHEEFEKLVAEEFEKAVPRKFLAKIKNVAFLVEDAPSEEVRKKENLSHGDTLLGYYHGIPHTARGDWYGMGAVLPDTITLYQKPIEEEGGRDIRKLRRVIRETIWHEIAHHFGMDEGEVGRREEKRDGKIPP